MTTKCAVCGDNGIHHQPWFSWSDEMLCGMCLNWARNWLISVLTDLAKR